MYWNEPLKVPNLQWSLWHWKVVPIVSCVSSLGQSTVQLIFSHAQSNTLLYMNYIIIGVSVTLVIVILLASKYSTCLLHRKFGRVMLMYSYIYVCLCIHACTYAYVFIHVCMLMYSYMYICIWYIFSYPWWSLLSFCIEAHIHHVHRRRKGWGYGAAAPPDFKNTP